MQLLDCGAHHESRASQIPAILAKLKEQDLRMAYPGAGQDRLFGADYEHQGRNCTDCDPSRLVKRESRLDNNPIIHYGAIASANQVMKHGKKRDRISKELNVLCFEMEAAGLMDNFPCLVIRGICDYADSHKTKEWQPYASATAAAYAKELLLIMHTHEVQKAVVASSPNARSAAETEQNRSLLLNSLQFESVNDRHDNIKKAHAETCQWLMQHPDCADWQDPQKFSEHHGLLWISGKPGAGKSTIMKFAVSQASRREQGTVISYFFNARGEDLEKTVPGLYRSLLYQLLRKLPDLQEILDDQSHSLLGKDLNNSWSIHRLKFLFLKAIERLGSYQVTCFIDALDECAEEEVREMLAFFEELGECAASSKVLLYACFSSRHYPHIHIDHCLKLTLEAQAGHAKDLEDYVRTKLKNEDGESPQTIEIVEEIIQKASGVFMWAVLVIDILNMVFQKGRMFAVRKRLDTIPEKLSDLFRDMLVRDNENMDEFRLCIQWILYSRRPLKRQEFYFAMVSGLYPESLEHQGSAQISRDALDRFVIDSSKGLAQTTVTSEKTGMEPTVQFIHESVRDFLLKDNGIEVIWPQATPEFEATSHEKLKSCCASYIKMADLGFLPPFNSVPVPYKTPALTLRYKVVKQSPFMEYANSQLFHHADCAAGSTPQVDFMEDFLSTGRAKWIVVHNLFEWREVRQLHGTVSLLCILAIHNSACLIRQYFHHDLQERGPRSWPTMEHHCTPLHAAIFEDAEEAAEALLLCSGKHLHKVLPGVANEEVDVDYSSSKGYTALLLAAEKGQDRVVKELLRLGADVTHKTNERNPLGLAIEKGHVLMLAGLCYALRFKKAAKQWCKLSWMETQISIPPTNMVILRFMWRPRSMSKLSHKFCSGREPMAKNRTNPVGHRCVWLLKKDTCQLQRFLFREAQTWIMRIPKAMVRFGGQFWLAISIWPNFSWITVQKSTVCIQADTLCFILQQRGETMMLQDYSLPMVQE
ncbi:hypothetical protein LY78DRAFT_729558 [Colletotrichum sublineola]|nr:hypothetical protein LY78DRAFT_729558 [Colletotrichum sublineola]